MYDLDEKRKYFNDIKNEYTFDLQYQVNIYFIQGKKYLDNGIKFNKIENHQEYYLKLTEERSKLSLFIKKILMMKLLK